MVRSVLAFINRNPGAPTLAVGMFNFMLLLGASRYCRRKDKEAMAEIWAKDQAKWDTAKLAIGTSRLEDEIDGLY